MNPEFTTAIRAAKLIRVCAKMMQPDRSRFHRLSKFILHHVIHADNYHRAGERQILIENLKAFEGYEFDPECPLSRYMPAGVIISMQKKITVAIPAPLLLWPEQAVFCTFTLSGVEIDFQSHTVTTVAGTPHRIAKDQLPLPPVYLETDNHHPLFLVLGMAYTNSKAAPVICQAVKIIAVSTPLTK